ncbi:hypothetical protein Vretifemale_19783 [Volvox reticuliferus]|uniref:Uncharacterized protein n=1 Tax=Volvox reticuliferus TaxID=1737510 RepID=A0A8J4D433_9CHLO|nr:hypothetical protein Vretifemale_19783 [Volvox reticuliferus]
MGNKLATNWKTRTKKALKGKPVTTSLLKWHGHEVKISDENALEAELRAAHESAAKLVAGVDLLADELRLEQRLAALDDEDVTIDSHDVAHQYKLVADDDDLDLDALDPEELAELEGELQDLERLVMGISAEEEEAEEEAEERSVAAQEVAEDEAAAMEEGEELVGGKMRQSPPDEPSATAAGAGVDAPDTATAVVAPDPSPGAAGEYIRQKAMQSAGGPIAAVELEHAECESGLRTASGEGISAAAVVEVQGEREKLDAGEEPAAVAHYS